MKTNHKIIFNNATNMDKIESESVDLMITSPPYPMIQMWDEMFSEQSGDIKKALKEEHGDLAFELMHKELDKVWKEVFRVLKKGGIACVNVGDATRKINSSFKLYPNHARIISYCSQLGFHVLPEILWRKQTNAPNKFMGSGMLPPGAYVTLEHEYILILRKGGKREFKTNEEKANRQNSSYFWEERNIWFSDIWIDIKGNKQKLSDEKIRNRSAAYPFELAYRLINMFSVHGDIVLDPFLGTGTTTIAAMASGRNSIGVEIDQNFLDTINEKVSGIVDFSNMWNENRLKRHLEFVKKREEEKGKLGYVNEHHKFHVMTRQERMIKIPKLKIINYPSKNIFEIEYD
ncbi:MAG: site-specific DNA-methyltransferase [Nanoarchaeota archaeon]